MAGSAAGATRKRRKPAREEAREWIAVRTPVAAAEPATAGLDPLVHDRTRLGMLSVLAVNRALGFVELKRLLGATDGNLSVHARKLERAGLVACDKTFHGRVPRTEYRITGAGRRALGRYLDHMEALIRATRR